MNDLILFFGIYALDIAFIVFLTRIGWRYVGLGILVNMILISVYAQELISIFGYVSNVGNIFFAAAVFGLTLASSGGNIKRTFLLMNSVFVSMMAFVVFGLLAQQFEVVTGNEEVRILISKLFNVNFQILGASFFAFYASNIVNYTVLQKYGKIRANVCTQFVDSAIFFPIAFYSVMSGKEILIAATVGFALKSILNIVDTPVYNYLKKNKHLNQIH